MLARATILHSYCGHPSLNQVCHGLFEWWAVDRKLQDDRGHLHVDCLLSLSTSAESWYCNAWPDKGVAITLWYLSNNISYQVVAQAFGVAQSIVAFIVIEVCLVMKGELYGTIIRLEPLETVSVPGMLSLACSMVVLCCDVQNLLSRMKLEHYSERLTHRSHVALCCDGVFCYNNNLSVKIRQGTSRSQVEGPCRVQPVFLCIAGWKFMHPLCSLFQAIRGFIVLGFPHCVGAIDCTHVYIRVPDVDAEAYIDRKKCFSVIVQAIIDSTGLFVDTSVGNVGRDHDAHVLRCSNVFDVMETGP